MINFDDAKKANKQTNKLKRMIQRGCKFLMTYIEY